MQELNLVYCLLLEDEPGDRDMFKNWLEDAWNTLNTGVAFNVVTVADPDDAYSKLSTGQFHILIADIMLGKHPLGLRAIERARTYSSKLAIIALSITEPPVLEKAKKSGADQAISKRTLYEKVMSLTELGGELLKVLRQHGFEPTPAYKHILGYDEGDYLLVSLLDEVGRGNVCNFCRSFAKAEVEKIRLTYVRSGLSGASVLKVIINVAVPKGSPPQTLNLLLKISKDQESLHRELEKDITNFPPRLFIDPWTKEGPVISDGFSCIAYGFENDAKTLLDWLVDTGDNKPQDAEIESVMEELFLGEGLSKTYSSLGTDENERPNVLLWETLIPSRRARMRVSIHQLDSLAQRYDSLNKLHIYSKPLLDKFTGDSKLINNFVPLDFPQGSLRCWNHGDLHGRNILVKKLPQRYEPHLIDRADISLMHWSSDVARLSVDLLVSGLDFGDESHEWVNIAKWFNVVKCFVANVDTPTPLYSDQNHGVLGALSWIRRNFHLIYNSKIDTVVREWEFRLALAIEFLRATYRIQELPSPKRVLGIYGACLSLNLTAEAAKIAISKKK